MRRLILLLVVMAISLPLWAAVHKTATWERPAQRVNGDALDPSEIAGYDLECMREDGSETVYVTGVPGEDLTHVTPEVFDEGSFVCRMRTIDTDGLLSTWNSSNVFTVGRCETSDCRPEPPSSIVIHLQ